MARGRGNAVRPMNQTQHLLRKIAARLWLAAVGRRWAQIFFAGAAFALLALLAARLLGLPMLEIRPAWLAAWPFVALLAALLITRRASPAEAARAIDMRTGAKELFLTATLAGGEAGEFQPIVTAQAEARAEKIRPREVIPWRGARGVLAAAGVIAVLAAGLRWLPQLDPFRKVAQRDKVTQQAEQLREMKRATVQRAETLARQAQDQSGQVRQALAALDKTFKDARPQEREASLQRLAEEQRELGELWRKVQNPVLKNALEKGAQSFGRMDAQKLAEWREQLKKGDASGLKKELAELRADLQRLAAQPDSAEKRAQQEALAQRLNQMAEGLKQLAGSPQLEAAMARAQAQLDLAKSNALSPEAMEGALDSLALSEKEIEQLTQALKDGQALEEALKNLQMARQLAGQGQLDGEACKNAATMSDYAALFAAKMAQLGEPGSGGSGLGPGLGDGSKRPENEAARTGFKAEKSPGALAGGKMLLEWKTKQVGEAGARGEEFRDAVREVKQGVSEALQAEQVPPGYHEAIKRYFDTLPAK